MSDQIHSTFEGFWILISENFVAIVGFPRVSFLIDTS